jgi:hypothetical protein
MHPFLSFFLINAFLLYQIREKRKGRKKEERTKEK